MFSVVGGENFGRARGTGQKVYKGRQVFACSSAGDHLLLRVGLLRQARVNQRQPVVTAGTGGYWQSLGRSDGPWREVVSVLVPSIGTLS